MQILDINDLQELSIVEAATVNGGQARQPALVAYEDVNFAGAQARSDFTEVSFVGPFWNDRISSLRIVSGAWTFYRDANFQGPSVTLGPGRYSNVTQAGIPNDWISSFKTTTPA